MVTWSKYRWSKIYSGLHAGSVSFHIAAAPVNEIQYNESVQYFHNFLPPCKQFFAMVAYAPQKEKRKQINAIYGERSTITKTHVN